LARVLSPATAATAVAPSAKTPARQSHPISLVDSGTHVAPALFLKLHYAHNPGRYDADAASGNDLVAPRALGPRALALPHMLSTHRFGISFLVSPMRSFTGEFVVDSRGEQLQVEIVAYGPGSPCCATTNSPVKDRIGETKKEIPNLVLSMCGNAKAAAEKREGHEVVPLAGVRRSYRPGLCA